ncbi:MAG: hypothetical protein IJR90_04105 [Clostridia bacterium]|nr:hypothetical protein [Clostridia bacterium]
MFKRTKFFIGVSLLAQSISFFVVFIVLAVKKKSLWKTFFAAGLIGGTVGAVLTVSSLMKDRKFRRVLEAVDDLCAPDAYEPSEVEIPVDDTADETEFEG